MARVNETLTMFAQNATGAKERLRAMLRDAGIRLEISPAGEYIGHAEVFPLMLMVGTKNAEPLGRDSAYEVGSGDAQCWT